MNKYKLDPECYQPSGYVNYTYGDNYKPSEYVNRTYGDNYQPSGYVNRTYGYNYSHNYTLSYSKPIKIMTFQDFCDSPPIKHLFDISQHNSVEILSKTFNFLEKTDQLKIWGNVELDKIFIVLLQWLIQINCLNALGKIMLEDFYITKILKNTTLLIRY